MKVINREVVNNKNIVIRCDFNMPIKDGHVTEVFKIKKSLPTLEFLIKNNAKKIVILAHLGQPEKKSIEYSLKPVAIELAKILKLNSPLSTKINEIDTFKLGNNIFLVENVRFQKGERDNNQELAKKWASLGDIFVFDGFASAHRAESSTAGIAQILPSYAGFLVQEEIEKLTQMFTNAEKPFVLILGGKKVEDKLPVIKNLFGKVDTFIVGGGVANTFLAAKEVAIGKSFYEPKLISESIQIMKMILDEPQKDIFIPQDAVVSKQVMKPEKLKIVLRSQIAKDDFIVDIGPKTIKMITPKLLEAKTIFWNGSLGITEVDQFAKGSREITKIITKSQAETILAGGDTTVAVEKFGLTDKFNFVSTGGGAALEFLAGKRLPSIEALETSPMK